MDDRSDQRILSSPEEISMNELIEQLKSRVGLDDNKAHSAAQTVIEFLKQRLPQPIAGHLDSVLAGGGAAGLESKVEGFLGKKTA
jgi:uncharacterized protein (DUF2267 family)